MAVPRTISPVVDERPSNGAASSTTSRRSSSAPRNSGSHAFSPAEPESPNAAKTLLVVDERSIVFRTVRR